MQSQSVDTAPQRLWICSELIAQVRSRLHSVKKKSLIDACRRDNRSANYDVKGLQWAER